MLKKYKLAFLFFISCVFILPGCSTGVRDDLPVITRSGMVVVAPSSAESKLIRRNQNLLGDLRHSGVSVIQVGDEVRLILPSDRFFVSHSSRISVRYYSTLNKVAEFIKMFSKVDVKVAGYTDNKGPWRRNLSLSRAQAHSISRYLWSRGIDARLLYAIGYGPSGMIAKNTTGKGRRINRRVEISFR